MSEKVNSGYGAVREDALPCLPSDLFVANQAPEGYRDQFPRGRWQWLMRNRDRNGLDSALIQIGPKTILGSKEAFQKWLIGHLA